MLEWKHVLRGYIPADLCQHAGIKWGMEEERGELGTRVASRLVPSALLLRNLRRVPPGGSRLSCLSFFPSFLLLQKAYIIFLIVLFTLARLIVNSVANILYSSD